MNIFHTSFHPVVVVFLQASQRNGSSYNVAESDSTASDEEQIIHHASKEEEAVGPAALEDLKKDKEVPHVSPPLHLSLLLSSFVHIPSPLHHFLYSPFHSSLSSLTPSLVHSPLLTHPFLLLHSLLPSTPRSSFPPCPLTPPPILLSPLHSSLIPSPSSTHSSPHTCSLTSVRLLSLKPSTLLSTVLVPSPTLPLTYDSGLSVWLMLVSQGVYNCCWI